MDTEKQTKVTAKFGGTSNANAEQIKKVVDIILNKSKARFIVVSAPGKRFPSDVGITNLLIIISGLIKKNKSWAKEWTQVHARFEDIILGLKIESQTPLLLLNEVYELITHNSNYDFIVRFGEYIQAQILTMYLKSLNQNVVFIDTANCIFFNEEGGIDEERTYKAILSLTQDENKIYVFPGFYGTDHKGDIKVFSRGGSDLTGAIVAVATGSDVYKNWTDVDGFCTGNPVEVSNTRVIKEMSSTQARILSYSGAGVLHESTMPFLKKNNMVLHICNTNNPEGEGTKIYPELDYRTEGIVGVVGRKKCTVVTVEKMGAHDEKNFGARFYKVIADCGISYEAELSGTDESGAVILNHQFEDCSLDTLKSKLQEVLCPDKITVHENVGVINTIFYDSINFSYILLELAINGIHVKDCSRVRSGQLTMILDEEDVSKAVSVIHKRFFG